MKPIFSLDVPLFYIEFYKPGTDRLMDISETGYETIEGCLKAIEREKKDINDSEQQALTEYEAQLKDFVLDIDTSDKPPVLPNFNSWRYDMKPYRYLRGENGYNEVND
jgi:hypothetical protein